MHRIVTAFSDYCIDAMRRRVAASAVRDRLVHGTFWKLTGSIVSRALALVAAIVVARVLGKSHYGEWGMIQSTVGMFGTLAGFGLGTTATRFVAAFRGSEPVRAGRIIGLCSCVSWITGSVLAASLVLGSSWLAEHTLAAPYLTRDLQLSALLLLFTGVNGAQTGVLTGFEAFKPIARISLLTGLWSFPLTVGGALLAGVSGIIVGASLAQAIGCFLNLLAVRRVATQSRVPIRYTSSQSELSVLWDFSVPALLTQLVISAANWIGAAMLVRQPHGFAEMGAFNAANQWFNALIWLPYVVNSVSLPVLSERINARDGVGAVALLKMSLTVNASVVLPVMMLGCFVSRYIMMSYGSGFESAWPTLIIVLLNAGLLALVMPVGEVMSARGHMWLGFGSNLAWALIFLGTDVLFSGLTAFGLASARLLAYSVHAIFVIGYTVLFISSQQRHSKSSLVAELHEA